MIKKYVLHGFQVINYRHRQGRKPEPLVAQLESFLLAPKTLQSWAFFTLEQRCQVIEGMFEQRLSPQRLRMFYIRHNIRYLAAQAAYKSELRLNQASLHNERVQFAKSVLSMTRRYPGRVIYVDEAAVNTWMQQKRTWTTTEERVKMALPRRVGGVTIYGAIGRVLGGPVFLTSESTNAVSYKIFMRRLIG